MLVGLRRLQDGGGVDTGLGRERGGADIGRLAVGRPVQDLVEGVRDVRERLQSGRRNSCLEPLREGRLQQQRRDDRGQVGIAAALADAVQRALDLARAGAHCGERVGNRLAGIVVGMDADPLAREARDHGAHDPLHLVGQRAAVRVAKHDPASAGVKRDLDAGERVVGIGLVAVEKVLAVEHRLPTGGGRRGDRLGDRIQVLLVGAAERQPHMEVPGLADEADRVGIGLEEVLQAGVVGDRAAGALHHAEGGEFCAARPLPFKERGVGRIGAGIAALDIVDPELVEHLRDENLVLQREINARRLLAVARVVSKR